VNAMNRFHRVMQYLRFEDENAVISITNTACWGVIALLFVVVLKGGQLSLPDVAVLLGALAHYTVKKVISNRLDTIDQLDEQADKVDEAAAKADVAHAALSSTAAELKALKERLNAVDNRTRQVR
jgi:hypothetical protein